MSSTVFQKTTHLERRDRRHDAVSHRFVGQLGAGPVGHGASRLDRIFTRQSNDPHDLISRKLCGRPRPRSVGEHLLDQRRQLLVRRVLLSRRHTASLSVPSSTPLADTVAFQSHPLTNVCIAPTLASHQHNLGP